MSSINIPKFVFDFENNDYIVEAFEESESYRRVTRSLYENGYKPQMDFTSTELAPVLEELTNLTSIEHTKEMLDFWYFYYYYFYSEKTGFKEFVRYYIYTRMTVLLNLFPTESDDPNHMNVEDIMLEISRLIGEDYPFSIETVENISKIHKSSADRIIKEFGDEIARERITQEKFYTLIEEIVSHPDYPSIPKELLQEILDLDFIGPESSIIEICDSWYKDRLSNLEFSKRTIAEYLRANRYGGYYERLLLLPDPQRSVAFLYFETFFTYQEKENKLDLQKSVKVCLSNLEGLGIHLNRSNNFDLLEPAIFINKLRQCVSTFKNFDVIKLLDIDQKLNLMADVFFLRGIQFVNQDLSETEINNFLLSCKIFFKNEIDFPTETDEFETRIKIFEGLTEVALRALFSNSEPRIGNLDSVGQLTTFNLNLRNEEKLRVEFAGPPAVFKSTLISKFSVRTNALVRDESLPLIEDMSKLGLSAQDLVNLASFGDISIEKILQITSGMNKTTGDGHIDDPDIIPFLTSRTERDEESNITILAQDIFNQTAFYNALFLSGRINGIKNISEDNLTLRKRYIRYLIDNKENPAERPTLVVILLAEVEDILKRRKRSASVNENFLPILIQQYLKLYYDLTKPAVEHPPIGVLVLDTSRMGVEECYSSIVSAIKAIMGDHASDLLKEA